jgi:hypothetical protein
MGVMTGSRAERQQRTGQATLTVPVLLGDIARVSTEAR